MKNINKTGAWIRLVTSSVITLLLIVVLVMGITRGSGFSFFSFNFGSLHYPNESQYTVGDNSIPAQELNEIEINWISGFITLEAYDGDTIEIRETCPQTLQEGDRVRSLYQDGTLTIQYCQSKKFSLFNSHPGNKSLHIRIPQTLASDIKQFTIDSVNSDNTISGLSIQNCRIDNVSGNITVEGNVKDFKMDTVSGDCQLTSHTSPKSLDTDSVSGDFTLRIPENTGFTIEHDSVSGKLDSDFPTTLSGDEEFVYGDGGTDEWSFDSVSGDVHIQKLNK